MHTIIVAGLVRSGLTVTMQMLNAGGYKCAGEYPAFEPYPTGDIPWLKCGGKAVKLVDSHLHFPPSGDYRIIRLNRDLTEQAKSFNKFMNAFGISNLSISKLIDSFKRDYEIIDKWAKQYPVLSLSFEEIIKDSKKEAKKISSFVGISMDIKKMSQCVINRDSDCHEELLELQMN